MPLVVPLIGAAVGIGGSLLSAGAARDAGNSAAAAQTQASNAIIAEQRRQFDITQGNFAPILAEGNLARTQQGDLLGLHGSDAQASGISRVQDSPLYQSLYRTGQNTILANGAATGGLRGGNIQRSLADFGSDTLARVIQSQLDNLGGVAAAGQSGAGVVGGLGAQASGQISGALGDIGSAQAGAYLNAGKANIGAINGIQNSIGGLLGNSDIKTALGKLF